MQHETGSLLTADGLTLLTRRWWPDTDPKGVVLLVHGINEHSGRYAYMASHLMAHDLAVLSYDHRGHGRSEGERSYVDAFSQYLADLVLMHREAREQTGGLPIILMGHSLGGLIAAAYVVDVRPPDLAGLVLSSPALQIPADVSPFLQRISGVVSRIAPRLRANKLDRTYLSRDPKVVEAYKNDPLIDQGGVRARTGHEVLQATQHVREHPEAFTMPLYLFHGTADRITDPNGSRWLYAEAPSPDKTLKLYQGFYHETMNEPERDQVLDDLMAWLVAHC
ncbi:MAG: alpha/beta hydrolase [Rhodothermaceae bacterium]|nr:alpha/beta hydrolase [Rhodothermaceae bacterium]